MATPKKLGIDIKKKIASNTSPMATKAVSTGKTRTAGSTANKKAAKASPINEKKAIAPSKKTPSPTNYRGIPGATNLPAKAGGTVQKITTPYRPNTAKRTNLGKKKLY